MFFGRMDMHSKTIASAPPASATLSIILGCSLRLGCSWGPRIPRSVPSASISLAAFPVALVTTRQPWHVRAAPMSLVVVVFPLIPPTCILVGILAIPFESDTYSLTKPARKQARLDPMSTRGAWTSAINEPTAYHGDT